MSEPSWSPLPLARAILEEYDPAPYALIAAWKCVYRDDCADLIELAYKAATANQRSRRTA